MVRAIVAHALGGHVLRPPFVGVWCPAPDLLLSRILAAKPPKYEKKSSSGKAKPPPNPRREAYVHVNGRRSRPSRPQKLEFGVQPQGCCPCPQGMQLTFPLRS